MFNVKGICLHPDSRWIQEGLQEGSTILLHVPVIEDTRLVFRQRLGFEEIEMLCCDDGRNHVFIPFVLGEIELALWEQDCFGSECFASTGLSNPCNSTPPDTAKHAEEHLIEKPRLEGFQREWPVF